MRSKLIHWNWFFFLQFLFLSLGCTRTDPNQTKLMYMPDMVDTPMPKAQRGYLNPPDYSVSTEAVLYPSNLADMEINYRCPQEGKTFYSSKKLFEIFCSVCHGLRGKGKGSLRNYPQPPDITSEYYKNKSDGFFVGKMLFGGPIMPTLGHAVTEKERCEIVKYLRKLQG